MVLQKLTIQTEETPVLRVGLKWEPHEKDWINFMYEFDKPGEVHFKIAATSGVSSIFGLTGYFLKKLSLFPEVAKKFEISQKALEAMNAAQKKYLEDRHLPSYDLDLLCFCYDEKGSLSQLISPFSNILRNSSKAEMSVIHSGPDPDGVGVGFDEEVMISLRDVANDVHQMFFVISSENHGFDQIKDCVCSIIRTKDETPLLTKDMRHQGDHRTCVFAKLQREGDAWSLREIADYIHVDEKQDCPLDDTIDDILRSRYLR